MFGSLGERKLFKVPEYNWGSPGSSRKSASSKRGRSMSASKARSSQAKRSAGASQKKSSLSSYSSGKASATGGTAAAIASQTAQSGSATTTVGGAVVPSSMAATQGVKTTQAKESESIANSTIHVEGTSPDVGSFRVTSTDPATARRNAAQAQYVYDLRSGNVGLAEALVNPRSEQQHYGKDTRNLEKFLQERGYSLSNTTEIPDSIFGATKYTEAREAVRLSQQTGGAMGDLTRFYTTDKRPIASDKVQAQRLAAQKREQDILHPVVQPQVRGQWANIPSNVLVHSDVQTYPNFQTTRGQDRYGSTIVNTDPLAHPLRYSDRVDAGLVDHPHTTPGLVDDIAYYTSTGLRPLYNIPLEASNIISGSQTPVYDTSAGKFIGGLVESAQFGLTGGQEGRPLEVTMPEAWDYIKDDPIRFASELPAEVGLAITGGKLVSAGTKTLSATKTALLTSTKTPQVVKTGIEKLSITQRNYQKAKEIASSIYSKESGSQAPVSVEKINRSTFLITAGTEKAPVKTPAILVKFGREKVVGKAKESVIYTEYAPSVQPISKITIKGKLSGEFADAKKTGKFTYEIPATQKNMITLSDPKIQKFIKPIGYEVKEDTKLLMKYPKTMVGKAETPDVGLTKSRGILAEIKAESFAAKPGVEVVKTGRGWDVKSKATGKKVITVGKKIKDTKAKSTLTEFETVTKKVKTNKQFYKKNPLVDEPAPSTAPSTVLTKTSESSAKKLQEAARESAEKSAKQGSPITGYSAGVVATSLTTERPVERPLTTVEQPKNIQVEQSIIQRPVGNISTSPIMRSISIPKIDQQSDVKPSLGIRTDVSPKLSTKTEIATAVITQQAIRSAVVPRQQVRQKVAQKLTRLQVQRQIQTKAQVPVSPTIPFKRQRVIAWGAFPSHRKIIGKEKIRTKVKRDFRGNILRGNIVGVLGRERTVTYSKPGIRRIERTEKRIARYSDSRLEVKTTKELPSILRKKKKDKLYLGIMKVSEKDEKSDAFSNINLSKSKKSKKKKGKGQKKKSIWRKAKKLFN